MRISEALSITRDNVVEERTVWSFRIASSKTDQESTGATIYIQKSDWFDAALRRCCSKSDNGSLFAGANAVGIRPLTPHCFRRGGATHAIESGIETAAVQRRGRWRNPRAMVPYVNTSMATQGGPAVLI
ncbi:site-specific recombinase, phage integrase family [Oesophagostomum dentatum]|uniref:Site-specific recombinase, phage integrase family n=1 Tax=Oesophagostomum dentatum TaxID=61180 RepID=A0A0B1TMQ1_OESDE|nr:site-specific recombinase, phage integrase family [Oesophagostomum dentatum]